MAGWGYRTKGKADRQTLQRRFAFLTLEPLWEEKLASDDVCDAVVCALVARARDLGLTIPPRDDDELAAARREGWIHVTDTKPARLLA